MDQIDEFVRSKSTPGVTVKTIAKHFKLKRRKVSGYLKHSGKFEKIDPLSCGSNRTHSTSWRFSVL